MDDQFDLDLDELNGGTSLMRRTIGQKYCVELQLHVLKFLIENPTDTPKGHTFAEKVRREFPIFHDSVTRARRSKGLPPPEKRHVLYAIENFIKRTVASHWPELMYYLRIRPEQLSNRSRLALRALIATKPRTPRKGVKANVSASSTHDDNSGGVDGQAGEDAQVHQEAMAPEGDRGGNDLPQVLHGFEVACGEQNVDHGGNDLPDELDASEVVRVEYNVDDIPDSYDQRDDEEDNISIASSANAMARDWTVPEVQPTCLREKWKAKMHWPMFPPKGLPSLAKGVRNFIPPFPDNISVASTAFTDVDEEIDPTGSDVMNIVEETPSSSLGAPSTSLKPSSFNPKVMKSVKGTAPSSSLGAPSTSLKPSSLMVNPKVMKSVKGTAPTSLASVTFPPTTGSNLSLKRMCVEETSSSSRSVADDPDNDDPIPVSQKRMMRHPQGGKHFQAMKSLFDQK